MFGFGVLDNCVNVYGSIVFGFEFDSKIMAAAARNFLWAIITAISLGGLSIWPPTNKENFRVWIIVWFTNATISCLIVIIVSKNFKKNKMQLQLEDEFKKKFLNQNFKKNILELQKL